MAIITFCNRKGGTGKTTTAVHVAGGLAREGLDVLLVDLDPQAHATLWLGRGQVSGRTIVEFLGEEKGRYGADGCLVETGVQGLRLLPSDKRAAELEVTHGKRPGAAHMLRRALTHLEKEFHHIVIDTPPYIGLLMTMGLLASDTVFITTSLQFLAVEGLKEMLLLVDKVAERANPDLTFGGIIPVMFNGKLVSAAAHLKRLRDEFGPEFILPAIRQNVKLAEAAEAGALIFDFAPRSHGAQDYKKLLKTLILSLQAHPEKGARPKPAGE